MNATQFLYGDVGSHGEAINNQRTLYETHIANRSSQRGENLNILDFGCGSNGLGRLQLESIISDTHHRLTLYDPSPAIRKARYSNANTTSDVEKIFTASGTPFDIINISYVLCLLDAEDAKSILEKLQNAHPKASFIVIDYILKTRGDSDVVALLQSNEEVKWQDKLGTEKFLQTHKRFDSESLQQLVKDSGISFAASDAFNLDTRGIRHAIQGVSEK